MSWQTFCDPAFSARLCLTLLHSLWQAALLAAVAWALGRLWRRSVERGYALHAAALAASLAAMPVTYAVVHVDMPTAARDSRLPGAAAPPAAAPVAGIPESLPAGVAQDGRAPLVQAVPAGFVAATPLPAATVTQASFAQWPRIASWLVWLYAAGVLLMLARLLRGMWHSYRLGCRAQLIDQGPLADRVKTLARQWALRIVPALATTERIVVPKLVGLIRPMILLPASAVTNMSTAELELILAHELAHVRRCDMWVNLAQRVAEVVLFFNPALWYLSRRVSLLREYCCDEIACRTASESDVEQRTRYAWALLRVVELSRENAACRVHGRTRESGELTALAAAGRSPSELRRRIARLFGEPLAEPLRISRGSLLAMGMLFITLLVVPTDWHFAAEPVARRTANPPAGNARAKGAEFPVASKPAGAPRANGAQHFELLVVGPDGKPVPQAAVEIRGDLKPTAEQIPKGQFLRAGPYGAFVKTDAQGELVLELAKRPPRFSLSIQQPGFGPYWAEWNSSAHPQPIPPKFTAELDAAWTIGGTIVDSSGTPIAGANVKPGVKYKKRPGDYSELWVGTKITTDVAGRWSFASVPVSMKEVFVEVNHPAYQPNRRRLTRSQFGIEPGQEAKARITLQRGLEVSGTVRDERGKPIAGALVRTKFLNDRRQATTGPDGVYRLHGCDPGMARIVVSALGKALDLQEVQVQPDMKPVDFAMKPGGKIRVRVVDPQGRPVAKARIFFQRWRGRIGYFEFDHVNDYTDGNGMWQWNEAPLDEIRADICPPSGMQICEHPLLARKEEYVVHTLPALVISGSVVDAETKKPVKSFRVVPGIRSFDEPNAESGTTHIDWVRQDAYSAADGRYSVSPNRAYMAHLVRIEADGYEVAVSRDIKSDEGKVRIDFAIKPARDIAATVLTPAGQPAAGAKIALGVAGSQINVNNGDINDGSTYAARRDADQAGRFRFPSQGTSFQLVITHASGFAHLKSTGAPIPATIRLTPWARVEGTFRVARQTVANAAMTLNTSAIHSYGPGVPRIFVHYDVTTTTEGRFAFERVFPGGARVGRRILLVSGVGATEVASSQMTPIRLVAGETMRLDLGGTGRAVVGKLAPPAGLREKVLWSFAMVNVYSGEEPDPPPAPADVKKNPILYNAWFMQWMTTDAGKAWRAANDRYNKNREAGPYFYASVDRDGSFRLDDVPPGKYVLSAHFYEHSVGHLPGHRFSVPDVGGAEPAGPINLGALTLTGR